MSGRNFWVIGRPSQVRIVLSKGNVTVSSQTSSQRMLGWRRSVQRGGDGVCVQKLSAVESPQRRIVKNSSGYTPSVEWVRSGDRGLELAPAFTGYAQPTKPNAAEFLRGCQRNILVVMIWHVAKMSVR